MSKKPRKIPSPYDERIQRLRAEMDKRRLDGFLVLDRMDQYWLTGFSGEDGGVLVTRRGVVLLTDGRFDETADVEAPFARKVLRKKRGPETIAREIKRCGITRLGFDSSHMVVKTYVALRKLLSARLVATDRIIAGMRERKDGNEIEAIRRAVHVAEKAFRKLMGWVKPGMSEREVAARLVHDMQRLGGDGTAFEPIVAVGPNASLPHYEPGDRLVSDHEGLLIDWGARCDWYVSDLTRVIWPGTIRPVLAKVYEIVRQAQLKAIAAIRPGAKARSIHRIARSHIEKAGYGRQFKHGLGHGIGLDVHESPGMGVTSSDVLEPGMVVTVEPGIYLPKLGGVRIEDDVLVTEGGCEVLSSLPTELEAMKLG